MKLLRILSSNPRALRLQVLMMIGFFTGGCGMINNRTPSTSCDAGTAIIQVYDGSLKRICGCAEAGNVTFSPGQSLTCTVSAGTRMYFNFVSIQQPHTVAVTGVATTPTMGPSSSSVQTAVILMNFTGTFSFQDVGYNTGGSIIVL